MEEQAVPTLDLELLAKLHEEATPGPWRAYGQWVAAYGQWVAEVMAHAVGDPNAPDTRVLSGNEFDCELVAAMRNALPELLVLARSASEAKAALDWLNSEGLDTRGRSLACLVAKARAYGWNGKAGE